MHTPIINLASSLIFLLTSTPKYNLDNLPKFEDYPIQETFNQQSAKAILIHPLTKKYKTVITDQTSLGPNFAGHFTLISWGCGTGCEKFVIANNKTGQIYIPNEVHLISGYLSNERISFKLSSNLLILLGRPNDKNLGQYFYTWNNNRLNLIFHYRIDNEGSYYVPKQ